MFVHLWGAVLQRRTHVTISVQQCPTTAIRYLDFFRMNCHLICSKHWDNIWRPIISKTQIDLASLLSTTRSIVPSAVGSNAKYAYRSWHQRTVHNKWPCGIWKSRYDAENVFPVVFVRFFRICWGLIPGDGCIAMTLKASPLRLFFRKKENATHFVSQCGCCWKSICSKPLHRAALQTHPSRKVSNHEILLDLTVHVTSAIPTSACALWSNYILDIC